jgi:hypothetical protein
MNKMKIGAIILIMGAMALGMSACGGKARSASDQWSCVFNSHWQNPRYVGPGETVNKGSYDHVIHGPANNRFYMAAKDDKIRDPLAPEAYEAFAQGQVKILTQGQIRFRFKEGTQCDWFARHGRRNATEDGDLEFNARGQDALTAGWFHWLSENMGVTLGEVNRETANQYSAKKLVLDYPSNADENGILPKDQQPAPAMQLVYGIDLGKRFTDRLDANLGGEFFCGTDPDPNNAANACPPMRFQVIKVDTKDENLENTWTSVETTRQNLDAARQKGDLQNLERDAVVASEKSNADILEAKARSAEAQARIDTANCRQLAQFGLDCEGHRPNGGNVTVNQAKP